MGQRSSLKRAVFGPVVGTRRADHAATADRRALALRAAGRLRSGTLSGSLVLLITFCLMPAPAPAAERAGSEMLSDRFEVDLGAFALSTSTEVRLDGTAGTGDLIDLERDLGFDDVQRFRLDFLWRISRHNFVRAMWYENNQSASRTADREFDFGDITVPVGASVGADLSTQIVQIAYEYAFLRKPRYEFTGIFGIHAIQFGIGVNATVSGPGGTTQSAEHGAVTAPLPMFGARAKWRVGRNLYIDGAAQYFQLSYQQYDGNVGDYRATLTWMAWRHFGIGAGYNSFRFKVEVTDPNYTGDLRWGYGGLMVFLTGSF